MIVNKLLFKELGFYWFLMNDYNKIVPYPIKQKSFKTLYYKSNSFSFTIIIPN